MRDRGLARRDRERSAWPGPGPVSGIGDTAPTEVTLCYLLSGQGKAPRKRPHRNRLTLGLYLRLCFRVFTPLHRSCRRCRVTPPSIGAGPSPVCYQALPTWCRCLYRDHARVCSGAGRRGWSAQKPGSAWTCSGGTPGGGGGPRGLLSLNPESVWGLRERGRVRFPEKFSELCSVPISYRPC